MEDDTISAVRDFCEAALEKGDYAPAGRDKKLHRCMTAAVRTLHSLGEPGAVALHQLLQHESPHVRSWIAAELLSRGDVAAKAVLQELAARPGFIGTSACIVLEQYEAGRLRSPFGTG